MSATLERLKREGKLAGWWDFRKTSLLDQSGNGNHLTVGGVPSWKLGKFGYEGMTGKNAAVFLIAGSASMAIQTGTLIVFGEDLASDNQFSRLFYRTTDIDIDMRKTSSQIGFNSSLASLNYIGLKCVASRFANGEKADFFNNGVFSGSTAATVTIGATNAQASLGNRASGTNAQINKSIAVAVLANVKLTNQEISQLYDELMAEHGASLVEIQNTEYSVPKVTDSTLVCHIDGGDKAGNIAPDLSGNGNNGTVSAGVGISRHPVFGEAMKSNGANFNGINLGAGNVGTRDMGTGSFTYGGWFRYNDSTINNQYLFSLYSAYPLTHILVTNANSIAPRIGYDAGHNVAGAVTVALIPGNWYHMALSIDRVGNTMQFYLNGVATGAAIDISALAGLSMSSGNNWWIGASAAALAGSTANYKDCRIYKSKALSAAEIKEWYNHFATKPTYKLMSKNLTPTLANVTSGKIGNSPFTVNTGTWKVSENTDNSKSIEGVALGSAYRTSKSAFGTWIFKINKTNTATNSVVRFIATTMGVYSGTNERGYYITFNATESFKIYRNAGSGTITQLGLTADAYAALSTDYWIAVSRDATGVFKAYIKGGAFTNWTLMITTAADLTYTASSYLVLEENANVGTKYTSVRHYQGVLDLSTLPND